MRHHARMLVPLSICAMVAGLVAALAAEEEQFLSTGVLSNHVFDVAGFDSVDVLNGNLHFEQILYSGQVNSGLRYELKLAYNSSMWMWHGEPDVMRLGSKSSVGLGFRLHLGRIYRLEDPDVGDPDRWFYEDASGTAHRLKPRADGQELSYYWSQDSTYLRARKQTDAAGNILGWDLWLPDGTHYLMAHHADNIGSIYLPSWRGWYTTRIESSVFPGANWIAVQYDPNNRGCILQITDSIGRTVNFANAGTLLGHAIPGGYTQSVTVPASEGRTATYTFEYTVADVVPPHSTGAAEANELFLTRLVLPDGGLDLRFSYAEPGTGRVEGPVTILTFGLGGQPSLSASITYAYDIFQRTADLCQQMGGASFCRFQQMVKTRTIESAEGQTYTWDYRRTQWRDGCKYQYIARTDLADPYGNETRYLFTGTPVDPNEPACICSYLGPLPGTIPCGHPVAGLPDTIEYYGGTIDAGVRVRGESRFFAMDFNQFAPEWKGDVRFGRNVRLGELETFFWDEDTDGDGTGFRTAKVENADWDGMHWKEQRDFDYAGQLVRFRRTEYEVPLEETPKYLNWVMNTFTSKKILDARSDPNGVVVARSDFQFLDDGRLDWQRDLIDPNGPSAAGDVLTDYEYSIPPPERRLRRRCYQAAMRAHDWRAIGKTC